jgi:diguanylate cyclase (GGDEF)-like protein
MPSMLQSRRASARRLEGRSSGRGLFFDAGFATAFTDIAATCQFNWTDIIPHLYTGKFGNQNQHFATLIPPSIGELYLRKLVLFALEQTNGTPDGELIRVSLQADGFPITAELQTNVPPELTKLPRKETLLEDLSKQLGDYAPVALLFVDLDKFKSVNDQFGHLEGDKCLIDVVSTLGGAIRGKGKLYRYGGDEFCVLLPNYSIDEGRMTAERIRAAIEARPPVRGSVKVTASIGVASSEMHERHVISSVGIAPIPQADPTELVALADKAMYESKNGGGNRVSKAGGMTDYRQPPEPRLTPEEVQNRVLLVDLEVSIVQGLGQSFLVNVENKSDERVIVKRIKFSHDGVKLAETPLPKPNDAWTITPRLRLPISWVAGNPDPALKLMGLLRTYAKPSTAILDVEVLAEILGISKICQSRIQVQVDPGSKRISQL